MIKNLDYYRRTLGWSGVYSAFKAKMSKTPVVMKITRPGVKAPLHLRMPSADVKVYEKVFLDQEYRFDVLAPPATIIDGGAHIGLTSVYFANKYPNARIIAVEPERHNFELLKRNVALYSTVTPVNAALWSANGEVGVSDSGGGSWGFVTGPKETTLPTNCGFRHMVRGITVDALLEMYGVEKVDILKLDVEGAEFEIFRHPSPWLDKVGALIIELHERLMPGSDQVVHNRTSEFLAEWVQGENVFLAKADSIIRPNVPPAVS